jgi:hypothetical protein
MRAYGGRNSHYSGAGQKRTQHRFRFEHFSRDRSRRLGMRRVIGVDHFHGLDDFSNDWKASSPFSPP